MKSYVAPCLESLVPSSSVKIAFTEFPDFGMGRPDFPAAASHVALTAFVASSCGTKKA